MTPPTQDHDDPGPSGPAGSWEEWSQRERYRELLEELAAGMPR